MPRCRIFLFTYKRNQLFLRALESLFNQTFTDWVCEVHDDDPSNDFVENQINSLKDDRFLMKRHQKNLGAVKSFNHAFTAGQEEFSSMLEDDNWWQPQFLQTAIDFLDSNPDVNMVWANMHMWQEKPGNEWEDTKRTVWNVTEDQIFNWPHQKQVIGHLHSTGAMVYRNGGKVDYQVPENTLLNAVEAVRERNLKHPIALLAAPLANFAITLSTNRSSDKTEWIGTQVMLLSSYILASPDPKWFFENSLAHHRTLRPNPIANFFLANRWLIKDRKLNRLFTLKDKIFIFKWLVGNAMAINKIKRYTEKNRNVYDYLLQNTSQRFQEIK